MGMLQIKKVDNGLLLKLMKIRVYNELLLPVRVRKSDWKSFAVRLLADIERSSRYGVVNLERTERRTEFGGCLDERKVYQFLKDNPLFLEALASLYKAGEELA
jgi:hypothetical protein